MIRNLLLTVVLAVALLTGCGDDSNNDATPATSPTPTSTASSTPNSAVVGLWEQTQTCEQLVAAYDAVGLIDVAPGWVTNYFPDSTGEEIANKGEDHLCDGAKAAKHSHFFTADGQFGSLDQNGEQVDDGPYEVIDADTMTIGEATFTYAVTNGELVLRPVISEADREAAHADPYEYTTAGWQVSVAYDGMPFHSVPCGSWC